LQLPLFAASQQLSYLHLQHLICIGKRLQVQFQLQQTVGGSGGAAPTLGRSTSRPPSRRSPTKHRTFQLSDSPWKSLPAGVAPLGQSQAMPSASGLPASPRKSRTPSKSPIRTARSEKVASSPDRQPIGSPKGAKAAPTKGNSPLKRPAERQSSNAEGQSGEGSQGRHSPDVMSFGSYGGVAFSSFAPAVPAGTSDATGMAAEDDEGGQVTSQTCK